MRDPAKAATAEVAFELGKITRRALDHAGKEAGEAELHNFANNLLEAGFEKIDNDLLMVFVAGFHEGDPPERRAGRAER
ncbi:hypothetical protein HH212_18535 [Massilia forsythiae]|uniref:Uncharacterized protein n=1 Tax=Massilia forsythiae TaxID=2728020 RepID=A0A7Z2VYH5_9BURK|nr:hypothetical protein [Massilia forsythiae]QJE01778.1 hypothetical protein HH212_18535 [Massilia forsythiae]